MKILLDECVPRILKRDLPGHEVSSMGEMGWLGKKNGELLRLMSGKFDVFLTVDRNIRYQQKLEAHKVALVIVVARDNRYETLKLIMPRVLEILPDLHYGQAVEVF